jgi:4-hydroxy-2-oxoheptanedioate aldolase
LRENKIRSMWQKGESVINGWLVIPSSWSAELMAQQGWDSLTIDAQHGILDYQMAVTMLQAISTTDVTPLVRVPWNEPGIIMKMLDAGAYGIICPMINTQADCEAFVGACRYYPQGYRSLGPTRATIYAGADYADHANDTVITMAMIETAEAVENIDTILSVPGLDAIYVGPADLSTTLGGKERADLTEPHLVAALDKIVAACRQHNIIAGIHTISTDYAQYIIEKGYRFVTLASDNYFLATAAQAAIKAMRSRKNAPQGRQATPY